MAGPSRGQAGKGGRGLSAVGDAFAGVAQAAMPDPWVLALLLTLVAGLAAVVLTPTGPLAVVRLWADGLWGFLAFAMQMALVLVGGHAIAASPPVRRGLDRLASLPRTAAGATALTAVVAAVAGWVNWGLGLIAGAWLAREMARQGERRGLALHYPLLGAAGYLGMLVWHGGLSGSAPLLMASAERTVVPEAGVVPVAETLFHPVNLLATAAVIGVSALLVARMVPRDPARMRPFSSVVPDAEAPPAAAAAEVPHRARVLAWLGGAAAALVVVGWAVATNLQGGRTPLWTMAAIDAATVAFLGQHLLLNLAGGRTGLVAVLSTPGRWLLAVVAAGAAAAASPDAWGTGGASLAALSAAILVWAILAALWRRLVPAPRPTPAEALDRGRLLLLAFGLAALGYVQWRFAQEAFNLDLNLMILAFLAVGMLLREAPADYVQAVGEAVPGTAGIILQFPFYAGILAVLAGSGLLAVAVRGLVALAGPTIFPLLAFASAAVVNVFVPSGGGQWAVQGPIVLDAAAELGVPAWKAILAVAYGDQLTNMLQPFWALPLLGITGLGARDVVGYTAVVMAAAAAVFAAALLLA